MQLPCTAVVLTNRETPILWEALQSLTWAEKTIVVDNESGIAAERFTTAGVSSVLPLSGPIADFAAVRNQVMRQVTTPWCFFLDSDEVVDALSSDTLADLSKLMNDPAVSGLTIKRSDIFLKKKLSYGEAGNQALIRFMRPEATTWVGAAHEQPQIVGQVQTSGLTISHYSHESINSFIVDVSSYAKIIANERAFSPALNLAQLVFFPPLKLIYDLFVLGGILDGWRGVTYSYCMALHSVLVRIYNYEKHLGVVSQANTAD